MDTAERRRRQVVLPQSDSKDRPVNRRSSVPTPASAVKQQNEHGRRTASSGGLIANMSFIQRHAGGGFRQRHNTGRAPPRSAQFGGFGTFRRRSAAAAYRQSGGDEALPAHDEGDGDDHGAGRSARVAHAAPGATGNEVASRPSFGPGGGFPRRKWASLVPYDRYGLLRGSLVAAGMTRASILALSLALQACEYVLLGLALRRESSVTGVLQVVFAAVGTAIQLAVARPWIRACRADPYPVEPHSISDNVWLSWARLQHRAAAVTADKGEKEGGPCDAVAFVLKRGIAGVHVPVARMSVVAFILLAAGAYTLGLAVDARRLASGAHLGMYAADEQAHRAAFLALVGGAILGKLSFISMFVHGIFMAVMQVKLTALDVAALDASLLTVEVRGWTDVERITERLLSLLEDAAAAGHRSNRVMVPFVVFMVTFFVQVLVGIGDYYASGICVPAWYFTSLLSMMLFSLALITLTGLNNVRLRKLDDKLILIELMLSAKLGRRTVLRDGGAGSAAAADSPSHVAAGDGAPSTQELEVMVSVLGKLRNKNKMVSHLFGVPVSPSMLGALWAKVAFFVFILVQFAQFWGGSITFSFVPHKCGG